MNKFDWDANDYNKNSSMQYTLANELIPKLGLKGNERVLDVGCGDGKITAEIAKLLPDGSIVGIDISEDMINFSKKNFASQGIKNIDFIVDDATKMDFYDEFDLIVSFTCLHWIEDHVAVLNNVRKALKNSGRLFMQCGGKGNMPHLIEALLNIASKDKWSKYFENFNFPWFFYGIDEYNTWLEQIGLIKKRVELVPKDIVHKGKEGLMGWIRTTWMPYTSRVPKELQSNFIEEIVDLYMMDNPIDDKGLLHVHMVRLEVEAIKLGVG
ncbi:class I SAM-dependent methyltransferase [Lutispora sp.]|uniref:class I SAM-dependent methyltransferase n=1 Tax=Lutispora sp. TaxID=2828727 RepID=UPI0035664769